MENNVFDSYEAIDKALDQEFGVDNSSEETEETIEPETIEEVTSDENESSNEEPEEQKPVEEETQPQQSEGSQESKKDYAFSNLRAENSNLKRERDGYKADSDYLRELAASYGYDDVSKFQEAIRTSQYQREAKEKGYDPALYKKTMEQERRIAELEREKEEEKTQRQLDRFQTALSNASSTYGIDEKEILDRLEEEGVTVEEILSTNNHKLLINGVLINEIKNNAKQDQIQDLQNIKSLAEDKNEQSNTAKTVTIDSLLKEDMAIYKKENFYD